MTSHKLVVVILYIFTCVSGTIQGSRTPETTNTTTPMSTTTEETKGDYSITVEGSAHWKETITVKQKKIKEEFKRDNQHFAGIVPKCCSAPSNKTDDIEFATRRKECKTLVRKILGKEVDGKINSRSDWEAMNCFLQCTSRKAGLSDENGVINTHDMTYYTLSDTKMDILGITSEMVKSCIVTSKSNIPNMNKSSIGGDVCNTANHEHIKFVGCLLKMENMNCPEQYQVKSIACNRFRDNNMK